MEEEHIFEEESYFLENRKQREMFSKFVLNKVLVLLSQHLDVLIGSLQMTEHKKYQWEQKKKVICAYAG